VETSLELHLTQTTVTLYFTVSLIYMLLTIIIMHNYMQLTLNLIVVNYDHSELKYYSLTMAPLNKV